MKYAINYKRSALEELIQLPENIAHKVKTAINSLAENPRPIGCIKLKGSKNDYRIRIGKYRVIYTISDQVLIVVVIKVANRKDVYR
jgi:mRNA interferase RelE/StbE